MKNSILRTLAAAAALLALIFTLAACGAKNASSGDTSYTPSDGGSQSSSGSKTEGGSAASGSGSGSSENASGGTGLSGGSTAAAPSAYVFRSGSVEIPVSVKAAPVLEALGKEKSYFEAESCAGLGTERYYIYGGYQVMTVEYYDDIIIGSVYVIDDTVTTPEGISLGDSDADVTRVYGEPDMKAGNEYTYVKGNCNLVFVFSSGVLQSVEYQANDIYD